MLTTRIPILLFAFIFFINLSGFSQAESVQLANEYYKMGEVDKAKTMYESLAKDSRNIPTIHQNYLSVLLE